jgi:transposase
VLKMARNELDTRKFVLEFFLKNKDLSTSTIAKECETSISTVQRVINRWNAASTMERRSNRARKPRRNKKNSKE